MNFDHVNQISDFCRENLFPHFSCKMQVNDFGNYLSKMVMSPTCKWMKHDLKALPINYFVNPVAFAKKHSKKCVAVVGTGNPQDGALNIIYQISPTFHVLARLFNWIEHNQVQSYLTLTVAYRDLEEFTAFFDDNKSLRLTGNTEEREVGFSAAGKNSGFLDVMQDFEQGSQDNS